MDDIDVEGTPSEIIAGLKQEVPKLDDVRKVLDELVPPSSIDMLDHEKIQSDM